MAAHLSERPERDDPPVAQHQQNSILRQGEATCKAELKRVAIVRPFSCLLFVNKVNYLSSCKGI